MFLLRFAFNRPARCSLTQIETVHCRNSLALLKKGSCIPGRSSLLGLLIDLSRLDRRPSPEESVVFSSLATSNNFFVEDSVILKMANITPGPESSDDFTYTMNYGGKHQVHTNPSEAMKKYTDHFRRYCIFMFVMFNFEP